MRALSAIGLLAGLLLLMTGAGAAAPPDPDGKAADLSTAERQILDACLAEPGTDPAACGCYLDRLRHLLPAEDYALATGLAAAAMRGDGEAFRRLVTRHRLAADRLQEILATTDRALRAAERACERGDAGGPDRR